MKFEISLTICDSNCTMRVFYYRRKNTKTKMVITATGLFIVSIFPDDSIAKAVTWRKNLQRNLAHSVVARSVFLLHRASAFLDFGIRQMAEIWRLWKNKRLDKRQRRRADRDELIARTSAFFNTFFGQVVFVRHDLFPELPGITYEGPERICGHISCCRHISSFWCFFSTFLFFILD